MLTSLHLMVRLSQCPVRISQVEQVQQQIVDVVRRLEDAGEIDLHAEEGEEEFIQ